jgi:surface polysaccharide O-acyltransferase-like enzyme
MTRARIRNGTIDVLRGISILLVLFHHFNIAYRLDDTFVSRLFGWEAVRAVARNGNYGVTMFFVISGYPFPSKRCFTFRFRSFVWRFGKGRVSLLSGSYVSSWVPSIVSSIKATRAVICTRILLASMQSPWAAASRCLRDVSYAAAARGV